jgi:hypothetical protein
MRMLRLTPTHIANLTTAKSVSATRDGDLATASFAAVRILRRDAIIGEARRHLEAAR